MRAVTLFFVANIVLFFLAGLARLHVGVPFFIWVGIFNVAIVAQFWAFANDIYTPEQGKRPVRDRRAGQQHRRLAGRAVGASDPPAGPYRLLLLAAGS